MTTSLFSVASLLGGVLTECLGWEWVLFVNVPIGALLVWQAPLRLAESTAGESERAFDIPGAVSVTAGLVLLVDAASAGWGSTATVLRLAGALLLLAAFVAIERRSRRPLVPFSIFRLRTLRGANVVGLFVGMSLFSMFFIVTLYCPTCSGRRCSPAPASGSRSSR